MLTVGCSLLLYLFEVTEHFFDFLKPATFRMFSKVSENILFI